MGTVIVALIFLVGLLAILLYLSGQKLADKTQEAEKFRIAYYAQRKQGEEKPAELSKKPTAEKSDIPRKLSGAELRNLNDRFNADIERQQIQVPNSKILAKE